MADYSNKKEGKSMIYLLMIIVLLLLVVAVAVIVYLSSRMMSMEETIKAQPTAQAAHTSTALTSCYCTPTYTRSVNSHLVSLPLHQTFTDRSFGS